MVAVDARSYELQIIVQAEISFDEAGVGTFEF
jgi:hypothetical protein